MQSVRRARVNETRARKRTNFTGQTYSTSAVPRIFACCTSYVVRSIHTPSECPRKERCGGFGSMRRNAPLSVPGTRSHSEIGPQLDRFGGKVSSDTMVFVLEYFVRYGAHVKTTLEAFIGLRFRSSSR